MVLLSFLEREDGLGWQVLYMCGGVGTPGASFGQALVQALAKLGTCGKAGSYLRVARPRGPAHARSILLGLVKSVYSPETSTRGRIHKSDIYFWLLRTMAASNTYTLLYGSGFIVEATIVPAYI